MSDLQTVDKEKRVERLQMMALEAKTEGCHLEVAEIRYSYCGIPDEITSEYIYFKDCWEIESTESPDKPPKAVFSRRSKLINMDAVTVVGIIPQPSAS